MSSMRSMTSPPTPAGGSPVGQIERLMENRLASSGLALHRIHADPANPRQLTVGQAVDGAEREEDAGLPGHALERAPEVHRFHAQPADRPRRRAGLRVRSEEHTSELQSPCNLVCRLLLEKKKKMSQVCTLS